MRLKMVEVDADWSTVCIAGAAVAKAITRVARAKASWLAPSNNISRRTKQARPSPRAKRARAREQEVRATCGLRRRWQRAAFRRQDDILRAAHAESRVRGLLEDVTPLMIYATYVKRKL